MKKAGSEGAAGARRLGLQGRGPDLETLAAQALQFLAEDPDRLGRFMAITGLDVATLREAAGQPGFARGVLGYLAEHESLLIDLAAQLGLPPDRLGRWIADAQGGAGWTEP